MRGHLLVGGWSGESGKKAKQKQASRPTRQGARCGPPATAPSPPARARPWLSRLKSSSVRGSPPCFSHLRIHSRRYRRAKTHRRPHQPAADHALERRSHARAHSLFSVSVWLSSDAPLGLNRSAEAAPRPAGPAHASPTARRDRCAIASPDSHRGILAAARLKQRQAFGGAPGTTTLRNSTHTAARPRLGSPAPLSAASRARETCLAPRCAPGRAHPRLQRLPRALCC